MQAHLRRFPIFLTEIFSKLNRPFVSYFLFHCAVAHSCDDMALEEEIDNGDTDNADNVRSKAWSVVVEILSCVVVLEQRQGPHFLNPGSRQGVATEVIPEPKSIDDHVVACIGFIIGKIMRK